MTIAAVRLATNARTTPLGIDSPEPTFAWVLETDETGVLQVGYTLEVASSERFGDDTVWESGPVVSDLPFGAPYAGPSLESMRRYWWRVRPTCLTGASPERPGTGSLVEAGWSEPTWFETGLLESALWRARWIGGPPPASKRSDPALYLRGRLELPAEAVRARAYVSALGWYRLFVNGTDVTGDALVPRWTPLSEMVEYQTYDVTAALHAGSNVVAIAVGDGRYRGGLGLTGSREVYGNRIGALAQLEVELADGAVITMVTDESWSAGPGRIIGADPKNGERVDLRIPDQDWLLGGAPPARHVPAQLLPDARRVLVAEEVEPVRAVERLAATVWRSPSGKQVVDFGQNFAGVVRIRLAGLAGTEVRLTHGEVLTPAGEVDATSFTGGHRWAQRDVVVLNGAEEWYQPWFTIHGFRYVEVSGLAHELDPAHVEGVVLSSALPATGTFTCSDDRLNRLWSNVFWSVRSNFTDTPTDCPTRERAGWTGDIQAFAPTAAVLVDSQAFLRRYLRNLAIEQFDDGAVPIYIPSQHPIAPSLGRRMIGVMSQSVGWSDAAVLLPWTLYGYYGDRGVLERQYDSMRRWVDRMERVARTRGRRRPYVLESGFHFGEWLRPGENPLVTMARHVVRRPAEIATAYFAYSSGVLARAARVIGRDDDARRYGELSARVAAAWREAFVRSDGRLAQDRQDDYVRALAFDLLLPQQRAAAVERLVELIEAAGDHLGTGFLSTPMLLQALTDGGRADVALRLLFQTSSPSWLYQVERGATTVWETWEGYDRKGRGKESHNHYALGSAARWLTEGLAGLSPESPGYRRIAVSPVLAPELDGATTTLETPFGTAGSAWRREAGDVVLEVTVPAGSTARVGSLWSDEGAELFLGSGRHVLRSRLAP